MYGVLFVIGVGFVLISTNVFNVMTACAVVISLVSSLVMQVAGELGLFGIGQTGVFSSTMGEIRCVALMLTIGLIALAPLWVEKCVLVCRS